MQKKKLWGVLRSKQLEGLRFRRQHPIEPYIVDFICISKKLIIEADGGQHSGQYTYDKKRDAFLKKRGYRMLRFWNHDILQNIEGVYETILNELAEEKTGPPPQSSPFQVEEAL